MTTTRKKLPIGIQTFAEIIQDNHYYVDKTEHIEQLINAGKFIFLSRPRRFGKSLLIDTIAELFAANQKLFHGLYIEDKWDWQTSYPIIRFSFAEGIFTDSTGLNAVIDETLSRYEQQYGVTETSDYASIRFSRLIRAAKAQRGNNVVVLVDEYDKPILDNLTNPDIAKILRDGLRDLYSVIKGQDAHIKFAMLTGVSKFSKVSIFSGLNNLNDITVDEAFSAVCGYTQHDLETVFAPELDGLDLAEVKRWYNGYNWGGEAVYNPFDVLLFLQKREFKPYWFETGTPTFIIDFLEQQQAFLPKLNDISANTMLLSAFEIGNISLEALLFQSGYLTIKKTHYLGVQPRYHLGFPNKEVQASLNDALLYRFAPQSNTQENSWRLFDLLTENNFDELQKLFTAFFASIPYDWYRNNPIAQYEGYYASVFYAYFASLGMDIRLEDISNVGRIDMTVNFNGCYYLFEFKVVEESNNVGIKSTENTALKQLKEKNYAQKYHADGQPIYLIGVEFNKDKREVTGFAVEQV